TLCLMERASNGAGSRAHAVSIAPGDEPGQMHTALLCSAFRHGATIQEMLRCPRTLSETCTMQRRAVPVSCRPIRPQRQRRYPLMAETSEISTSSTFAVYWLFKLDPPFSRLSDDKQRRGRADYLSALEALPQGVQLRGVYSMVGLREDADLMLWVLGTDLDAIQRLAVALRHTLLGTYLAARAIYVRVVTPARYDPGHMPSFMYDAAPKSYISVYPFVKTTEWYLLPYERRRALMEEHGLVGRRYAVARESLSPAAAVNGSSHGSRPARTASAQEIALA